MKDVTVESQKKSLLISTVGRPTGEGKKRDLIKKYSVSHILGIIPEGDTKEIVYATITRGWSEFLKSNLVKERGIDGESFFIDLSSFSQKNSKEFQDANIIQLSYEVLKMYNKSQFECILFDVGSGRRSLAVLCFITARWLWDILTSSEEEMRKNSTFLNKFYDFAMKGNLKIITQPVRVARAFMSEDKSKRHFINVGSQGYTVDLHEFTIFPIPILSFEQASLLLEFENDQELEGDSNSNKSGGNRDFLNLLRSHNFIKESDKKGSIKLTTSGSWFKKFYSELLNKRHQSNKE